MYKVGRLLSKKRDFRTHKDFYLLRVFLSDAWLAQKAFLQSFQTSSSNTKQSQESSRSRYLWCAQLVFYVLGGFRNLTASPSKPVFADARSIFLFPFVYLCGFPLIGVLLQQSPTPGLWTGTGPCVLWYWPHRKNRGIPLFLF